MTSIPIVLLSVACSVGLLSACSQAETAPLSKTSHHNIQRALSLKVLQQQVRACQPKQTCSETLLQLAQLTRIDGYVIDAKNKDVILIGQVDPTMPTLYLEDFVLALRDAWKMYAIKKGDTYIYTEPGCTIDPQPRVMGKLQEIGAWLNGASPSQIQEGLEVWHQVCHMPQKVQVFGLPFHTRFAHTMVIADYFMKKLVDGSEQANVEGFASLVKWHMEEAEKVLQNGLSAQIPLGSMSRFWFYPRLFCKEGETCPDSEKISLLNKKDKDILIIDRFDIMLRTEEEYLNAKGEMVGRGQPDPMAKKWAEMFTKRYADIARIHPMYQDLENLGRFIALARTMHDQSVFRQAGLDIQWLLNQFTIQETHVDKTIPGHSSVKTLEHRGERTTGYSLVRVTMPSCGGVEMAVKVGKKNFVVASLQELKNLILATRPLKPTLLWTF